MSWVYPAREGERVRIVMACNACGERGEVSVPTEAYDAWEDGHPYTETLGPVVEAMADEGRAWMETGRCAEHREGHAYDMD